METFDKTGRGVNNKLPSDGMISVHLQDGRTSVIYQRQDHAGKTTKVHVKDSLYFYHVQVATVSYLYR